MKNVKCILFDLNLEGRGVVNYDGKDLGHNRKYFGEKTKANNNFTLAKKSFSETGYKLKISSNSLRNNIFREDINTSPTYVNENDKLFANYAISPVGLLRGFLKTKKGGESSNKKSAFSITDAIQTCDAKSDLEFMTNPSVKDQNSIFLKETVGDIEYKAFGNICLDELQFISCSPNHGRQALEEDLVTKDDMVNRLFEQHYGDIANIKYGCFNCMDAVLKTAGAEFGILLNNELVVFLVKGLLKRMLSISYNKSGAVANTKSLKIKFVQDITTNLRTNSDGWVELNNFDDIDNIDFEMFNFYSESNGEECAEFIKKLEENSEEKKAAKKLKKEEEKLNKELNKIKKRLDEAKKKNDEDAISEEEIKIKEIEDSLNQLKND